jgi:hypothetical protein
MRHKYENPQTIIHELGTNNKVVIISAPALGSLKYKATDRTESVEYKASFALKPVG